MEAPTSLYSGLGQCFVICESSDLCWIAIINSFARLKAFT